ncbi:glucan endo-1,3-beta-glucosidase 8-like [Capsicum chacoense]
MRLTTGIRFMIFFMITSRVNSFVGITWGRQQSQQFIPSMVVDLLLQNQIPALRLMTSASDIIQTFSGTNISMHIALNNRNIDVINTSSLAYAWVNNYVKEPIRKGVKIVELIVGLEPFSNTLLKDRVNYGVLRVMPHVREALEAMDLRNILTTTSHGIDVFNIKKVPSETEFREDIKGMMLESLKLFNKSGSPFVLNMFPLRIVRDILNYPIEFTYFDNMSNLTITDGNATYTNGVELIIDCVASTIINAGYPSMKIMIGEVGWPTDGYPFTNIQNAQRFYKGLLKFIASEKGTPLRPGPIDMFLHSLCDENLFKVTAGPFQRHWGIYDADGNPKYKIDFSLQDRNEYPTEAKGIVKMPRRWCTFNGDKSNMELVTKNYNLACDKGDCTPLELGASCGGLSEDSKISYAFNEYFQRMRQNSLTCDFDGLGKITTTDPSSGNCGFSVEILSFQDVIPYGTTIQLKV